MLVGEPSPPPLRPLKPLNPKRSDRVALGWRGERAWAPDLATVTWVAKDAELQTPSGTARPRSRAVLWAVGLSSSFSVATKTGRGVFRFAKPRGLTRSRLWAFGWAHRKPRSNYHGPLFCLKKVLLQGCLKSTPKNPAGLNKSSLWYGFSHFGGRALTYFVLLKTNQTNKIKKKKKHVLQRCHWPDSHGVLMCVFTVSVSQQPLWGQSDRSQGAKRKRIMSAPPPPPVACGEKADMLSGCFQGF